MVAPQCLFCTAVILFLVIFAVAAYLEKKMSVALDDLKAQIARVQTAVDTLAAKPPPVLGVPEADVQAQADALKPVAEKLEALANS